ncbi:fumarylacetoacetate hydrolase family protein [Amycolatopsis rubida]|uniref:2-keto-4-pentenoate hydratase/2-oxohepta-3-ene-1,7-dioic acid hydratase (Catechol pathway) n=1 Tax=Amycolatopsis rubida TaxID=112413 RepID=A0A1I5HRL4_9PSEU|nr:fumarylacetoacetate hydrolase family protein [Amycolatopsis rubida]SFO50932.1 2-keto-4-pentenoate hydratase/2-oxohepta-3-ene-1,7-dioic acid hydratase (catechol pathway) [Amycolatopsis rubida]
MKLANVDGQAVLLTAADKGIDVARASGGLFGLGSVYRNWPEFQAWARKLTAEPDVAFTRAQLGPPSPAPRQIVAIGLNYDAHAAESGFAAPGGLPPVFTKFVSSLTGPDAEVVLPPGGNVDWEVELVAVVGRTAHRVEEAEAWEHIAGVTIGQDLSERVSQLAGPAPQFSLGKSFPDFAPVGPWLVTPDELADRDDLALSCAVDGETVQDSRTGELIFPVGKLISALSRTITLYPGDLVFTGTPSGVGVGRTPQRFLRAGQELVSRIGGLGEMRQTFVAEPEA